MQEIAPTTNGVVENSALPFVLLPHQIDVSISGHPDFALGCQSGFEWYCESGADFPPASSPCRMQAYVAFEVCRHYRPGEIIFGVHSLPYRAGFCLGWLSGLACVRRDLACLGVGYLPLVVSCAYQDEVQRGFDPLVAVPGICKSVLS
jgi:hypothetical protein